MDRALGFCIFKRNFIKSGKIEGNFVKTHVCQNSNSPSKLGSPYCANGHGLEVESELVVHSSAHLENLTNPKPSQK